MKPNTKFIIITHFNNAKWNDIRLTKEWIDHKMEIYMMYTFKSLKNQTNQDFDAFVLYDPVSEDLIFDALSHYETLPENFHVLPANEAYKTVNKMVKPYDFICYNKLDSDNLYHKNFIQYLHDYMPKDETTILVSPNGYTYNALTGDMAHYSSTYASFYTQLYTVTDYLNKIRHPIPVGGLEKSAHIAYEVIDYVSFIITVHDTNVTNSSRLVHPSRIIHDATQVSAIWEEFTGETIPYVLKK